MKKLLHQDNIKLLKNLIEKEIKVDLFVCDPPYVISKKNNFKSMKDRNGRTGINFGKWDDEFDNKQWIKLATHSLKEGGSLIVFNDSKKISQIIKEAQDNGLIFKDLLVWSKTNPMPRNIERRYVPDVEFFMWFVKPNDKWTFNKIGKYNKSVFVLPSESGGGYKRIHPTQKPLKLIEEIIKVHSNKEDLVVDLFGGSFSTAIAANKLKRNFIVCEIDEDYFLKGVERYNEVFKK